MSQILIQVTQDEKKILLCSLQLEADTAALVNDIHSMETQLKDLKHTMLLTCLIFLQQKPQNVLQVAQLEAHKAALVNHMHSMETCCGQLTSQLKDLKQKWCATCVENVKLYRKIFELRKALNPGRSSRHCLNLYLLCKNGLSRCSKQQSPAVGQTLCQCCCALHTMHQPAALTQTDLLDIVQSCQPGHKVSPLLELSLWCRCGCCQHLWSGTQSASAGTADSHLASKIALTQHQNLL